MQLDHMMQVDHMVSFLEIEHLKQILQATPPDKLLWRLVSVRPALSVPAHCCCRLSTPASQSARPRRNLWSCWTRRC